MKVIYVLLNAVIAAGLFLLNGLLGKLQYGLPGNPFNYGKFTFSDTDDAGFSGNFFQKIVNPTVYLAVVAAIAQHFAPLPFIESMWVIIPIFGCIDLPSW